MEPCSLHLEVLEHDKRLRQTVTKVRPSYSKTANLYTISGCTTMDEINSFRKKLCWIQRYYYEAVLRSRPSPTRPEDFCSYEIMQTQPARRTGATKTECGRARIMQAVTLLTSVADRRLVGAEICTEQSTRKQSIGGHPIIHASIITDEMR